MLENAVRKINNKGWNLYEFAEGDRLEDSIAKGPVNKLMNGGSYALFPRIHEDKNSSKVTVAMASATERQILPMARYLDYNIPLCYFTLEPNHIRIHSPGDIFLNHDRFFSLLSNLNSFKYIA